MTEPNEQHAGERRTEPFAAVLQKLQGGRTARELGDAMQEVTEAVMATGRAGTITVQLKVSKSKASRMVEVADTVAVKMPRPDREVSMFFVDADSNLTRKDPQQAELEFGPVRAATPPPAPSAVVNGEGAGR